MWQTGDEYKCQGLCEHKQSMLEGSHSGVFWVLDVLTAGVQGP